MSDGLKITANGAPAALPPEVAALPPDAREALTRGYDAARRFSASMYGATAGDDYADYLARHDAELIAKGRPVTEWPASLQGNDGD